MEKQMGMVERVARAICRANVLSMMAFAKMQCASKLVDTEVDRLWKDDVLGARAAIEAMREPSEAMMQAMDASDSLLSLSEDHLPPEMAYTIAIDAALAEGEEGR